MLTDTARDLKELGGRDPRGLLGLQEGATSDEVRQAFRRQVMSGAHPDRGGDDATFRTLARAREILLDPQRRADYDAALGTRAPSRRTRPVPGSPASSPYRGASAPPTATATRPAPEPPATPRPANAGTAAASGIGAPGAVALVLLLLGPLAWPVAIMVGLIGLWLTLRSRGNSR